MFERDRRPQKHTHIQSFARSGMPPVIAASTTCCLFISEEDRPMLRSIPCSHYCIAVRRSCTWGEMQIARKDRSGERGFESRQIVHVYAGSAEMLIEMSAAFAEWVSAPTLMKSAPASA